MAQFGVANLISIGIGILGIILGIVFYLKSKKTKKPVYRIRTTCLIRKNVSRIDSLKILYDNQQLSELSISELAFWNAGRETIRQNDLSQKDKLRIEIEKDFEILSCDLISQTKDANDFSVQVAQDKKKIMLNFDYLDYNDGVILKIRHTGSSSNDLVIKGCIVTVKAIIRNEHINIHNKNGKALAWTKLIVGVLGITGLLYFFSFVIGLRNGFPSDTNQIILPCIILIIVSLLPLLDLYVLDKWNNLPVPKELVESYESEDF